GRGVLRAGEKGECPGRAEALKKKIGQADSQMRHLDRVGRVRVPEERASGGASGACGAACVCKVAVSATVRSVVFSQAEDGIRDKLVTGVQTCALPIYIGIVGSLIASVHEPGTRTDALDAL